MREIDTVFEPPLSDRDGMMMILVVDIVVLRSLHMPTLVKCNLTAVAAGVGHLSVVTT